MKGSVVSVGRFSDCKGYGWTDWLAGLNNPINPYIVSSLDLTKPRVNGLYPVRAILQTYYASPSERERSINRFMESYLIMSRITIKF